MSLTLTKGSNLSLTKTEPGLTKVLLGLGWSPRTTAGEDFDLDASAILLAVSGKVRSEADFVFYNQQGDVTLPTGPRPGVLPDRDKASVVHNGDNRNGEGDGDDETISVDLTKVPADVDQIVFAVSIDQADVRNQNFGQVRNAYIRVVNEDNNNEIVRFDLTESAAGETALNFAELYRGEGGWKFRAVGQGYTTGLAGVARDFGLPF